jgi:hypothetical protein
MALILTDQSGNQYSLSVNSSDGSLVTTPVTNLTPSSSDNSIFTTTLAMITGALRLLNVTASGELPTSDEANDALAAFQSMVDSWNADSLSIFTTGAADYPLTLSKQAYTLGPGGDFNATRPAKLIGMSVILLNNPANPIEVPIDMYTIDEWQTKIPVKNVSGSFPQVCYDDGGMPLRTLSFWPIPTNQPCNARVYSWQSLVWPATLQTILNFPPGYARAFRYNLAVELAPEFGAQISPAVMKVATESLAAIKTMNAPELHLISDLVMDPGGYNWKASEFGLPY